MGAVAVVDIGKTTAKLALVDPAAGTTLDAVTMPNRVLPGPPYPHADVDGLWRFILDGLSRFSSAQVIGGIAVTTHGATGALVGGDGLALPILDYEYDGPDATAAAYDAARPGFAETLSPRLPAGLNLGAQIFWQARAFSDAFSDVEAILAYPQYWVWRLTGIRASEATSLGCHTDLWMPGEGRLSSLVAGQGWTGLFPPLRPAASVLGPLLPAVAEATGLPPATPVACGIHDSNASLLPWLGRLQPPFTVVSSGTWTIVMTVGGGIAGLDPARDVLANVDAFGRPVPTARFMGGREYAAIAGTDAPASTPEALGAVLRSGVMALPSFGAGVGPFGGGRGRIEGPAGTLAPAERAALADLYLALVTRECLSLVGTGARIVVEGPLARNASFCGLLASLADVPVHPSPDATGTAMGAALLLDPPAAPSGAVPQAIPALTADGLDDYARAWRRLAGT